VPVLVDDGTAIWDTAAIFEHLYERHPGRMAKGPFRTRACAQHQRRDPLCV
jgi:glutathione S-transferase